MQLSEKEGDDLLLSEFNDTPLYLDFWAMVITYYLLRC